MKNNLKITLTKNIINNLQLTDFYLFTFVFYLIYE